jgi:deazaflavin-dependent oxidoreductase (nitroreductase family)
MTRQAAITTSPRSWHTGPDEFDRRTDQVNDETAWRTHMFLYLTTTGRISGLPREIEIWFTERGGLFYLIAEQRERANWVRNIQAQPRVSVRVADRQFDATARVVSDDGEPQLTAAVKALFDAKYGWSDGLVVQLTLA